MNDLVHDNAACLEQGMTLLRQLAPADYMARCPACFNSSVGGHIRHNTDHYEQFLAGWAEGKVDYDARTRAARVESEPTYAADLMRRLRIALEAIPNEALDAELQVKMDGGSSAAWSRSTVRRELQFLLSHTIHHYALIVAILHAHDLAAEIPTGFGVAPSTLKHRAPASA